MHLHVYRHYFRDRTMFILMLELAGTYFSVVFFFVEGGEGGGGGGGSY